MLSHLISDYETSQAVKLSKARWSTERPLFLNPLLYQPLSTTFLSGSRWTALHTFTFHIIHQHDVPINHIVPSEFFPDDNGNTKRHFACFYDLTSFG